MDKVLSDQRIINTIKFYAERRDWHNMHSNLWNKGVLFHNDSPASLKEKISKVPEFQKVILRGQLQDILFLYNSNRLNDFPLEELESLLLFFTEQINLRKSQEA